MKAFHPFRRGLAVVFILIFLFSAGTLYWLTILSPRQSQQGFDAYKDLLIGSTASAPSSSAENHDTSAEPDAPLQILPKFALLAAENPYFAGWLTLPDSTLDVPVFHTPDNPDYYIKRAPDGSYSKYGSPYLAAENQLYPQSDILVMYGHNMEYDDVLFGQLNKLKSLDYLQAHPVFTFDTLYQAGQWKVLAVCRASTDELATFPYNRTTLTSEDDFWHHLYQFRIRSMFRIPDDGGPDDDYLMLSTCSYLYWGDRLVILARRLRDSECTDIDTSAYEKNPLQLWPDKYYTLDYVHASRPTDTDIRAGHDAYYFR